MGLSARMLGRLRQEEDSPGKYGKALAQKQNQTKGQSEECSEWSVLKHRCGSVTCKLIGTAQEHLRLTRVHSASALAS